MSKRILMVLTSHSKLGNTGKKTGFWVEEFAAPYYEFIDAGFSVTLVTPKGGQAPIDPTSELTDFQTDATKRFNIDEIAQDLISNTCILSDINSDDFDGVFYPGGHGPLWDLTNNSQSIGLIESFLNANKPIAAVCHATAAFLNAKEKSGEFVVKNKAITGFSNTEEEAVQLTNVVPFLLEDELIKRGSDYQKISDWHAFAIQDGLVITGQNPASSSIAAQKLLAHITK
ncbi:type 1 glutamine amidotransferase domain-containing protein [Pseudoalteromonas denitrificans]|uniref:type 1 glutamine amidotransferase domain-containing protein n=1 Tax=Pseudoalteromonas denitrificans TaxID=43656 RepID=UPI000B8372EB|nr:type 1 glutamine amidotransferase domain-containing protein [Pseudoalteromonas denitrificans]